MSMVSTVSQVDEVAQAYHVHHGTRTADALLTMSNEGGKRASLRCRFSSLLRHVSPCLFFFLSQCRFNECIFLL